MEIREVEPKTKKPYWGFAYFDEHYIELHNGIKGYDLLNTLVHELFHIYVPEAPEPRVEHFGNEVERIARRLKLIPEED